MTAIDSGSTTVGIDAPCLRQTAYDQFSQLGLWGEKPSLDDTALDLATEAINEAGKAEAGGDFFDDAVLGAILKLAKAGGGAGVEFNLSSVDSKKNGFVLNDQFLQSITKKKRELPLPRAFIVCGNLDEIRHVNGHFRLIVEEKHTLLGRLASPSSHLEVLRSLWGKKVTLEGMVSFKGNGEARFIEARKIRKFLERDAFFEKMPKGDPADVRELIVAAMRKEGATKLTDLIGIWPGDETAEELIAELDD